MSRSGGEKGLRLSGAGKLSVPLEWDWYVGKLFELHQGCHVPFRISRGNMGFLLRCCSGKGLHLAMTGEPRGLSRGAEGFSSYNGVFRMPLILAQGSPIFLGRAARESWGLLSSHCRAKKKTSSRLVFRNYVFLSSGDSDLGVAFKIHPGSQALSRLEAKNSALLLSCDGYLLEPIEWSKGSQASCGFLREDSGLLSRPCRKGRASYRDERGISWVFFEVRNQCGVSHELLWGIQGAPRVAPGKSSLHSSCKG